MNIYYEIGIFLILGFATGFLSGLFGIGGGFLRIPIFVSVFPLIGVSHTILMHMAIGTSVSLIIPTAIASSVKQYKQGNLDLGFYYGWAIAILFGVIFGLFLVPYASTRDLQIIFLMLVVLIIVYLSLVPDSIVLAKSAPHGLVKALLAITIGLISALTGTGGGALTTPALKLFNVPLKKAIATASATGLVIGIASTTGFLLHGLGVPGRPHFSLGYIDLLVFIAMTPTVFIGAANGAKLSNRLPDLWIKRLFIVLMLVIAGNVFYKL